MSREGAFWAEGSACERLAVSGEHGVLWSGWLRSKGNEAASSPSSTDAWLLLLCRGPRPPSRPPGPLPARDPPQSQASHLAASPPGLRLETLGFPSLSVPPEMVRPNVLPSFLVSSTVVTPRNSSANRERVSGQRGANLEPPAPGQIKRTLG